MKNKDYPAALRLKEDKFITCIGNIRLKAEKILADSQHFHYTRHDVKHSETIIKRIGELLEEHPGTLEEQERFILIAAAYLHDIGMQYPAYSGLPLKTNYSIEELEETRKNHHEASYTIIRESVKNDAKIKLGLDNCEYYTDSIAEVAKYHRKLDLNKLEDTGVPEGKVRLKLLASLLRLGDTLDLDNERVIIEKLKQREIPVESKFHWWCHLMVRSTFTENGKIKVFLINPNYGQDIIDALSNKLKESVKAPFLETYDILDEYGLRLYKEPVFIPDKEKTNTAIDAPEDLINYIKESILGTADKDSKISAQSGAVWYSDGVAYSDDEEFKKFWSELTSLVENEKYNEALLLVERYEEFLIDPKRQMVLFFNNGNIYYITGKLDKALEIYQKAEKISEREIISILYPEESKKIQSGCLGNIGLIYSDKGDLDSALKYFQYALNIHKEIGSRLGEAMDLGNIGPIYFYKGELDKAIKYFQDALIIHKEIGSRQGEADQHGNIGLIYKEKGDLDNALKYFQHALKIHSEISYRLGEANQLCNIGSIYGNKGDIDKALKYLQDSLKIYKEIGYRLGEGTDLGNIGLIYKAKGDFDKALKYLQDALEIDRKIGYRLGEANQLRDIGMIFKAKGDLDKALKYLNNALKIHKEIGSSRGEAAVLDNIRLIYSDINNPDNNPKYLKDALIVYNEIGHLQGDAEDLGNIRLIYSDKGDLNNASKYPQEALKIDREIGYHQEEANQFSSAMLKITFYHHRSNKVFCTDIAEKLNFTGFKISLSEDIVDSDSDLLMIFCSENINLSESALSFINSRNKEEFNNIIPMIFKGTVCPNILNNYNKIIIEPGANIQAARKIINYIVYRILNKRSLDLQSITVKIHDLRNDNFLGNGTIISPYGDIVTSGEVLRRTHQPLSNLKDTKFEIKFPSFFKVLEARIANVYEDEAPFEVVFLKLDDNNRFSKGDCSYASLLPYSENINAKMRSYAWNATSYSEIDGEIINLKFNENDNYIKKFIARRSIGGISEYYCGSPVLSNDNYCVIGVIILVKPDIDSNINHAICCTSNLLKNEFGINNIFDNNSCKTSRNFVDSKMVKSKMPESNILTNEDKNQLKISSEIETKLDVKENLTNVDSKPNPLKVFLCYAKEDIKKVRNLYNKLYKDGVNVWWDKNELDPGDDWQLSIEKAIEECSIVIVCLSNKSINKTGYVNKEIKICLDKADKMPEGKIFIIPVRFEDCKVPERLIKWQYADYPEQYEKLIKALKKRV